MSTYQYQPIAARERGQLLRLVERVPPLAWAVIASRLVIVLSGLLSTAFAQRAPEWWYFDPERISSSFGPIGNALTATLVRWDSLHYLSVAALGYKPAGDTQFQPLYPLLIHGLGWVVGSDVLAGIAISFTAFGVGMVLLYRLTCEELGEPAARTTVLLLAFAPLSFFFTAIYTESLLLALTVGSFYLARHNRFRLACVVAALAAVTHGDGFLMVGPLAYFYWERRGRPRRLRQLISWEALALLLPLCTFVSVFVYQHAIGFGWFAPITSSQSIGHVRMMVIHSQVSRGQPVVIYTPILTILYTIAGGLSGLWGVLVHGNRALLGTWQGPFMPGVQEFVYLVVLVIALMALARSWRRLHPAYSIYGTLVLLLLLSREGVMLLAFDRYMLPIFPLWMSAGDWVQKHGWTKRVLQISTALLIFYTIWFARWVAVA